MSRQRVYRFSTADRVWLVEAYPDHGCWHYRVFLNGRFIIDKVPTVDDLDRCLRIHSQGEVGVADLTGR